MKKRLYIIKSVLLALAVMVSTTSCLDKYPESAILEEEAMQTYNDASQHLTGIYSSMLGSSLYSGLLTLLPDIQADFVYALDGFSNTYGNFWQWKIRSTDAELSSVYGALYAVIGNCNFFLDRIDAIIEKQTDETRINDLRDYKGQVYAIRALCYLELAKCFCKAYDPDTAKSELGVMLRTKYFEEEPAVRASLYDTYQLILDDLKLAEELIYDDDDYNGPNAAYMTQVAAYAIHARAALYMQDWDEAIKYSSLIIDEKSHLVQLASVNTYYSTSMGTLDEYFYMWAFDESPEVLFKLKFTTSAYGGALGSLFLAFNRDFTYFYPDYVPAQSILNKYTSGDARTDSFFADSANGITIGRPTGMDWPLLVKYYGNRTMMSTSTAFYHVSMPKVLRLSEQYLIRAEAYCNKGEYGKATTDVNTLRSKRFSSGGTMNLTASNWLDNLADERARELYMEGFRLHDLKRWNMGFKREKQLYSLDEGSTLEVKAGDPLFVWPIPQHELDAPGSGILPNESNK